MRSFLPCIVNKPLKNYANLLQNSIFGNKNNSLTFFLLIPRIFRFFTSHSRYPRHFPSPQFKNMQAYRKNIIISIQTDMSICISHYLSLFFLHPTKIQCGLTKLSCCGFLFMHCIQIESHPNASIRLVSYKPSFFQREF